MTPSAHRLIRANNALWARLYYDELVERPGYQLTLLRGADAGFYSCAQALTRADGEVLAEIEAYYRGKGVAPAVYLDPESPPALLPALQAAGWREVPQEEERCHVLDLSALHAGPPSRARLKPAAARVEAVRLTGPEDPLLAAFLDVDAEVNELPPTVRASLTRHLRAPRVDEAAVHCFVALLDGAVVATRVVGLVGDLALCAEGATLPAHRRGGIYSSLLLEGLHFARAAGARTAFLTASSTAHSNLAVAKLGFTHAFSRTYHRAPVARLKAS